MSVSTTIAAASDGAGGGSIWSQVVKEAMFVAVGAAAVLARRAAAAARLPAAWPTRSLALALVALCAVLVPGIGVGVYGARRWIDIGPLQLQPSRTRQARLLLWGADLLARKQQLGTLDRARHLFLPLLPGFLLFAALVMLEPDLGTTCCFLLILLGLLWTVGMPLRYFAGVLGAASSRRRSCWPSPRRTGWQRMTTFLHPFKDKQGSGFHTVEGLYALASGGIFGVGLGQGTSKYGWVPERQLRLRVRDHRRGARPDRLPGRARRCSALLAFTGMRVARRSADPFVRLAAGAATVWICGQARDQHRLRDRPAARHRHPAAVHLRRRHVAARLVRRARHAGSFARHEPQAVAAARRAERRGERSAASAGAGCRCRRRTSRPSSAAAPPRRDPSARRGPAPGARGRDHPAPSGAPTARRATAIDRRRAARRSRRPARPRPLRPTGTDGAVGGAGERRRWPTRRASSSPAGTRPGTSSRR